MMMNILYCVFDVIPIILDVTADTVVTVNKTMDAVGGISEISEMIK